MNLMTKLFGASYDDLWKAVIRPPRDNYEDYDLGPEVMLIKNKNFKRTDFTILNKRNHRLYCSFWEPFDEEREYERLPCVVYLHGNSSSRAEAVSEVAFLLPMNICLFAFDFSGCGKSEGEYISLGWYEREDVECIIDFLRKSNKVSTIGLWGRSMGAVTAIMYGDRDPSIAGMVLDSPFSSLKKLVEELVKDKVNLPNFVINQALKLVKSTVQKKANFRLDDIEPVKFAEHCFIPALFVAANNDNFVKPHHAKILHDIYPGDKNLVNIEGDHNSHRPRFFKDSATIFFYNTLQVQFIKEVSDNYAGYYKKKNDIFEDEKKEKIINNENERKSIAQVNNDVNLNNLDLESIEDEEELLNIILEKSKKDFEEMENKNNIEKKPGENLINLENKNNGTYDKNKEKNDLMFFLNSQVKTNNKDNINDIKQFEHGHFSNENDGKHNRKRESNNDLDLINLNLDDNKGKTDRKGESFKNIDNLNNKEKNQLSHRNYNDNK